MHREADACVPPQEATASRCRGPQHCALAALLQGQIARWEQGKVGTCALEVKMAQGVGA